MYIYNFRLISIEYSNFEEIMTLFCVSFAVKILGKQSHYRERVCVFLIDVKVIDAIQNDYIFNARSSVTN